MLSTTLQNIFQNVELVRIGVNLLQNPHIIANRLSGGQNLYKIKLRSAGYRLVYQVEDDKVVVFVIAVGKREKNAVYDTAEERLAERQSDNQDTQSAK
ncbi:MULTISPECIES: type II toxin-antitoxin system RelE/ParE family toxin [unclassified Moraxella]|uniref:mRNA interferase RelE n=1 Tax=Moraxella lacunata TaxID=477 RepID=A0A1B8Q5H1_MORLA|nr:type II toxin-antitoxin system RelE/ParE family toxin [Moraxella lacunata]MBE9588026.1 type II toxin-antitoxin system RelE/ParE family toxin [Moraxella sp. K1630]MBE9595401.1 type II toxin-antitoxin system RelE/ParE family toxin [Moraxella sp. K2450]MDH9219406.1 type II toxin-antitoxin system RelE/ParE family toxin [Moraxella lacunata]MDI4483332.1 type II toxin-antitoxin system RelE/ParE family toxin [Moraxella lacunata]MDI4507806.1 type II toxin-antitoxin system RelE/ParE family toxin [Mor